MQLAFYIGFGIHTLILLAIAGIGFMQASDFKYYNKKNLFIAYSFIFFILLTYVGSLLILMLIDFDTL